MKNNMNDMGVIRTSNQSVNKLVSIITPMYNDEKYIGYFLKSILSQTYGNIEFIIVDDGSTDRCANILETYRKRFEEKGISLIYLYQEHAGQAAAINKALRVFHGEYLKWMDSDDMIEPECIEKQVHCLENNPQCGFCFCDALYVNYKEDEKFEIDHYFGRTCQENGDPFFMDILTYRHPFMYGPGSILVRREAFEKAISNRQIIESKVGQNLQLLLPLTYYYKCVYLHEALFIRVIIENSHCHMVRSYEEKKNREISSSSLKIQIIKEMKLPEEMRLIHLIQNVKYNRLLNLALCYSDKKEICKQKIFLFFNQITSWIFYGRFL